MIIKPSSDRKTKAWSGQYNTFGTLPGPEGTCPGATCGKGGCCDIPAGRKLRVCYVNKIMSCYPTVRAVLAGNTELKNLTIHGLEKAFRTEFDRYLAAEQKRGFITDHGWCENSYRIHWSGDLPNTDYATALATVMQEYPIDFWNYTRSLGMVPIMAEVNNCVTYISADADNYKEAVKAYKPYKDQANVAWCYLSKEKPEDQELQECPVDSKKMDLEGACHKCRKCLNGVPIWFKQK